MTMPTSFFSSGLKRGLMVVVAGAVAWSIWTTQRGEPATQTPETNAAQTKAKPTKPALTVHVTQPQQQDWPQQLAASGNVAAWQEAVISAEISNFRLTEVRVNVGDTVTKGQTLARISAVTVDAELAESRASVAEAEAMLTEARANGDRARQYQATGFISAQQINQYLTAEKTALARLNAARARLQANQLRLAQTVVRAPDNGVISARSATVGSLAQPGQELFRLIRGGRLEWRAEVGAADLARLKPGTAATLVAPNGVTVTGRVRMVAPTVDPQTLNGLVYVDVLPAQGDPLRAGSFARGEFTLGSTQALSLPQSAVLQRDGFAYVFLVDAHNTLTQTKVTLGRRAGERVEITGGITPTARVVASGAGFLADGDSVRVVDAPAPASTASR